MKLFLTTLYQFDKEVKMGDKYDPIRLQNHKDLKQETQIVENQEVKHYNQNYYQHVIFQYEDMHSQPSPTFQFYNQDKQLNDDTYSQTIAREHIKMNSISGIHQKYLQSQHIPNEKVSFRSQRKLNKEKPLVSKFKKQQLTAQDKHKINQFNPICQGLLALQIDTQKLKEEINTKTQNQQQKASLFSQLGMKQPKVLGKGKTQRQIKNIKQFIQSGQVPSQYINDFLLSIST